MENRTVKERRSLVEKDHVLSIRRQSELLEVNRSSLYIKPVGESKENLDLMARMDRLYTKDPTLGVLGMQDELLDQDLTVNHKRIRRLLRKMAIEAIYPKRNLSRLGKAKYIHPYLLRHLKVERPNQVWAIDINIYNILQSQYVKITGLKVKIKKCCFGYKRVMNKISETGI